MERSSRDVSTEPRFSAALFCDFLLGGREGGSRDTQNGISGSQKPRAELSGCSEARSSETSTLPRVVHAI